VRAQPRRDADGKIGPHDHPEILPEHHVIRRVTPNDIHPTEHRRTSGAFSESSDGGMSVDIEEWMAAEGLSALHYVENPDDGAVRLSVGELRKLGFHVGWDPDRGHPHHGCVWGIGNGSKRKRRIDRIAVTIKKAAGEA
jgi:hypothetical protein